MCEPIFYKMWDPQRFTTPWASAACYKDIFTFLLFLQIQMITVCFLCHIGGISLFFHFVFCLVKLLQAVTWEIRMCGFYYFACSLSYTYSPFNWVFVPKLQNPTRYYSPLEFSAGVLYCSRALQFWRFVAMPDVMLNLVHCLHLRLCPQKTGSICILMQRRRRAH
jgi:hypothetical protein